MQAWSTQANMTESQATERLQRRGSQLSMDLAGCTSNWSSVSQRLNSVNNALLAKQQQLHHIHSQHQRQQECQVLPHAGSPSDHFDAYSRMRLHQPTAVLAAVFG